MIAAKYTDIGSKDFTFTRLAVCQPQFSINAVGKSSLQTAPSKITVAPGNSSLYLSSSSVDMTAASASFYTARASLLYRRRPRRRPMQQCCIDCWSSDLVDLWSSCHLWISALLRPPHTHPPCPREMNWSNCDSAKKGSQISPITGLNSHCTWGEVVEKRIKPFQVSSYPETWVFENVKNERLKGLFTKPLSWNGWAQLMNKASLQCLHMNAFLSCIVTRQMWGQPQSVRGYQSTYEAGSGRSQGLQKNHVHVCRCESCSKSCSNFCKEWSMWSTVGSSLASINQSSYCLRKVTRLRPRCVDMPEAMSWKPSIDR